MFYSLLRLVAGENKKDPPATCAVKVSLIKSKLDGNARPLGHAVDVTRVSRTQLLPFT